MNTLPQDAEARKAAPMAEGLLYYFPAALAEVARVSKRGNDQHNPGQPLHWARGKSTDHADCILRHLTDAGTVDADGQRHTAKVAWRALALLQEELEREGAPIARNARVHESTKSTPRGHVEKVDSAHPMAAEILRDREYLAEALAATHDYSRSGLRDAPPFARCQPYGGTD